MTAPTLAPPGRFAAPKYGGNPGVRALAQRATTPRALALFMAGFLVVNFARTHELVPWLIPLRLGKLTGYPMLFLLVFAMPRAQLRAAFRTRPGRAMLFIGAWMVLGVPFAIWQASSFAFVRGPGLIAAVMFAAVAAGLADDRARLLVLRATVLAIAVDAMSMLLPGASYVIEDGGAIRFRFGYTYDPNDSATLFIVAIPLALYLGARGGRGRVVWFAAALPMIAALVRTGSRGGLFGLAVMLLSLVLLSPPRQRTRFALAGVVAAMVFGGLVANNPSLRARVASVFSSSDDAGGQDYNFTDANGRVAIWKRGMRYMITHPITGVGVANFGTAELLIGTEIKASQGIRDRHQLTAHNSFVLVGAELGIPGLIAYVTAILSAGAGLWRLRRDAGRAPDAGPAVRDQAALASAVLAALAGGTAASFFLSIAYSPMLLFVYALCIAVLTAASLTVPAGPATAAGAVPVDGAPVPVRRSGMRGGAAVGAWAAAPHR